MASDFTEKKRKKISDQLNRSLGPEYLSMRPGFGATQLTYVEGWLIISLANKIFGFDGWSSEVKSMVEDYSEFKEGKISVGYTCCCRVTLKNGIYKEDVGFGSSDNQKQRGLAIEKAKKEAATDALKRALRQFGNALGNCCYDKEFLKQVHKTNVFKKANFNSEKLLKKSDIFDSSKHTEDFSISFNGEVSDS